MNDSEQAVIKAYSSKLNTSHNTPAHCAPNLFNYLKAQCIGDEPRDVF